MSRIAAVGEVRQRDPRVRDPGYLRWLHVGLPCVACLIEGDKRLSVRRWPYAIEAAHQKLAIASAGWSEGGGGQRTHDDRCVPLCSWHHRLAPDACDNGQRAFWDRLGLGDGVADLAGLLYAAYGERLDGARVITTFAALANNGSSGT